MSAQKGEKTYKYAKIYQSRREQLIEMVFEKNRPINKASKRLGIKYSTAKLIVKKYKETGTFFMKKKPAKAPLPAPAAPMILIPEPKRLTEY